MLRRWRGNSPQPLAVTDAHSLPPGVGTTWRQRAPGRGNVILRQCPPRDAMKNRYRRRASHTSSRFWFAVERQKSLFSPCSTDVHVSRSPDPVNLTQGDLNEVSFFFAHCFCTLEIRRVEAHLYVCFQGFFGIVRLLSRTSHRGGPSITIMLSRPVHALG